jgi:hypothetical protein
MMHAAAGFDRPLGIDEAASGKLMQQDAGQTNTGHSACSFFAVSDFFASASRH